MSRQTAQTILCAAYGQLITLDTKTINHVRSKCLSRLILLTGLEYREELIYSADTWAELCDVAVPGFRKHYDERFDLIEQSYLDTVSSERRARKTSKANSAGGVHCDNQPQRDQDS